MVKMTDEPERQHRGQWEKSMSQISGNFGGTRRQTGCGVGRRSSKSTTSAAAAKPSMIAASSSSMEPTTRVVRPRKSRKRSKRYYFGAAGTSTSTILLLTAAAALSSPHRLSGEEAEAAAAAAVAVPRRGSTLPLHLGLHGENRGGGWRGAAALRSFDDSPDEDEDHPARIRAAVASDHPKSATTGASNHRRRPRRVDNIFQYEMLNSPYAGAVSLAQQIRGDGDVRDDDGWDSDSSSESSRRRRSGSGGGGKGGKGSKSKGSKTGSGSKKSKGKGGGGKGKGKGSMKKSSSSVSEGGSSSSSDGAGGGGKKSRTKSDSDRKGSGWSSSLDDDDDDDGTGDDYLEGTLSPTVSPRPTGSREPTEPPTLSPRPMLSPGPTAPPTEKPTTASAPTNEPTLAPQQGEGGGGGGGANDRPANGNGNNPSPTPGPTDDPVPPSPANPPADGPGARSIPVSFSFVVGTGRSDPPSFDWMVSPLGDFARQAWSAVSGIGTDGGSNGNDDNASGGGPGGAGDEEADDADREEREREDGTKKRRRRRGMAAAVADVEAASLESENRDSIAVDVASSHRGGAPTGGGERAALGKAAETSSNGEGGPSSRRRRRLAISYDGEANPPKIESVDRIDCPEGISSGSAASTASMSCYLVTTLLTLEATHDESSSSLRAAEESFVSALQEGVRDGRLGDRLREASSNSDDGWAVAIATSRAEGGGGSGGGGGGDGSWDDGIDNNSTLTPTAEPKEEGGGNSTMPPTREPTASPSATSPASSNAGVRSEGGTSEGGASELVYVAGIVGFFLLIGACAVGYQNYVMWKKRKFKRLCEEDRSSSSGQEEGEVGGLWAENKQGEPAGEERNDQVKKGDQGGHGEDGPRFGGVSSSPSDRYIDSVNYGYAQPADDYGPTLAVVGEGTGEDSNER